MQKTTTYLKATLLAITLVLGSAYVSAWTAPVSDPPGGSVALPINTGNTDQIKTGGLGVGNLNSVGNIVSASGVIKPGSFDGTVTACGSAGQPQAGSMRYNSTAKTVEYCDGTAWKSATGGGGTDWKSCTPYWSASIRHGAPFTYKGKYCVYSGTGWGNEYYICCP